MISPMVPAWKEENGKEEGGIRERAIHCDCGKLLAIERGGKVFVYCRRCKRQIPVDFISRHVLESTQAPGRSAETD